MNGVVRMHPRANGWPKCKSALSAAFGYGFCKKADIPIDRKKFGHYNNCN